MIGFYAKQHGSKFEPPFDGRNGNSFYSFKFLLLIELLLLSPGTLAHTSYPTDIDFHLDDDEEWILYPDQGSGPKGTDLLTVSIHEIGYVQLVSNKSIEKTKTFFIANSHKLGLKHSKVKSACLFPIYNSKSTQLDPDDIEGIQNLYGAKHDQNEKESELIGK